MPVSKSTQWNDEANGQQVGAVVVQPVCSPLPSRQVIGSVCESRSPVARIRSLGSTAVSDRGWHSASMRVPDPGARTDVDDVQVRYRFAHQAEKRVTSGRGVALAVTEVVFGEVAFS
ncbi:hypothetical protein ACWED2_10115 [Amycolatopsis sp. NPDC005003]